MERRRPGPRKKPPAGWPAWLAEQRATKDWTQKDVFERIRKDMRWGDSSVSLYGDIERGTRELNDEDKLILAALYGKRPDDVPEPEEVPPATDLAGALLALVEELRAMRQERVAQEDRLSALEAIVRSLEPPLGATPSTPSLLPETRG